MSEQLLCSCDGFCGASKQACRLADDNLERILLEIILEFKALHVKARGDGPSTIAKLNKMPLKPARKDKDTFS